MKLRKMGKVRGNTVYIFPTSPPRQAVGMAVRPAFFSSPVCLQMLMFLLMQVYPIDIYTTITTM